MQGKSLIKTLLILLAIITAYQFFLIIPTRKIEKQAEEYAQRAAASVQDEDEKREVYRAAKTRFLDSVSSEVVFSIPLIRDYTYTDLKKEQLALGLDLKGGMSVMLQADLKDLLINLSKDSKDPAFRQALDNAEKRMRQSNKDFITLFGEEYKKLSGGKKLATIFMRSPVFRNKINFETSDEEVLALLRQMANEAVDQTYKRLKDRIDKMGVTQPNVSLDQSRDIILVELPGVENPERARRYLQAAAKLEFWDIYRVLDPGILDAFIEADKRLKQLESGDTTAQEEKQFELVENYDYVRDTVTGEVIDSVLVSVDTIWKTADPMLDRGPLLRVLDLNVSTQEGLAMPLAVMGQADKNKRHIVDAYLSRPEIRALFPRDLKFAWSHKPAKDYTTGRFTNKYYLYALKKPRGSDEPPLTGEYVVSAEANPNPQTGEVEVLLTMDAKGARIWADMTTRAAADNNREIAIVLDDEVVSAPSVRQPITGGRSSITGNFTLQEAKDLANILQVGKLPTKTHIIEESLVGPTLGKENIARSLRAILIGFLLVFFFMIFYYGGGGVVAILALIANIFFILGALASFGTVLTLPGIAGIVLTIGMAVDANVIIMERIREELNTGKTLYKAVVEGFNRSYSAIIDANVTTILVAIVLAYYGLGPIKGFAVVLIIGVLMSLLTAVLMGRMIIEWWLDKGKSMSFSTPWTKNLFQNLNIDWMGMRRKAYVFSAVLLTMSIISFFTRGFDFGVDFKGGYSFTIEFPKTEKVSAVGLRKSLKEVFGSEPIVKAVDVENVYNVTTDYLIESTSNDAQDSVVAALYKGVQKAIGRDIDFEQFKHPEGSDVHINSMTKVGPTIADDIQSSARIATILALIVIFLYILVRFNRWQFSLGAVLALFHDAIITLGGFSLLHGIVPFALEIDQAFIAALLTVIGYSINDTVVVFDRVREFINFTAESDKTKVFNKAINATFSRTIITSLTTIFVVLVLVVFGSGSIRGFAFALLIGITIGTYSSIFIATSTVHDLTGELKGRAKTTDIRRKYMSKSKV